MFLSDASSICCFALLHGSIASEVRVLALVRNSYERLDEREGFSRNPRVSLSLYNCTRFLSIPVGKETAVRLFGDGFTPVPAVLRKETVFSCPFLWGKKAFPDPPNKKPKSVGIRCHQARARLPRASLPT